MRASGSNIRSDESWMGLMISFDRCAPGEIRRKRVPLSKGLTTLIMREIESEHPFTIHI